MFGRTSFGSNSSWSARRKTFLNFIVRFYPSLLPAFSSHLVASLFNPLGAKIRFEARSDSY